MEESVMRDLKGARNLFRAYIRNGDYANAKRILKEARIYLQDEGEYLDGFKVMGEFLAPEDEFSRRAKAVSAFLKSTKTYEFLDDKQNASLVRNHLSLYLSRASRDTDRYVENKFNSELAKMSEPIEQGDWESARNHLNISRFYGENGGFGADGKISRRLNRLERGLEYLDGIESFQEKVMNMQPPEEELFSTRSQKIENLHKRALFVNSLRKAKKLFHDSL